MAIELKLPDMGGEVTDVTITRWLVKEGDAIKTGDVILEVATDKVDTEVPASGNGTLLKRLVNEGELVPVSAVLGYVGQPGEAAGASETARADAAPAVEHAPAVASPRESASEPVKITPVAQRVAESAGIAVEGVVGTGPGGRITKKDVLSHIEAGSNGSDGAQHGDLAALPGDLADAASLDVRRLAAENNVDLRAVAEGRPLSTLTKYDVLSFIASREAGKPVRVEPRARPEAPAVVQAPASAAAPAVPAVPAAPSTPAATPVAAKAGEEVIPHSRVRQLTARNTAKAAQTIPHVTTWWDVNMAAVLAHRKAHKDEFAAAGVNLTVTAYLIQATIAGLKAMPAANSTWTDEAVIVKRYYNVGMAAALPGGGLIVPVIKNADELNLLGLARAVNDLAVRARDNKLKLDELQGGTFTITNYGTSGSRFQTPIIVEGQAGILGVGAIEKRPVVVSNGHPLEANTGDYLAFLPMLTLGFSYDHRILDGATADAFCAAVKAALEAWR